MSLVLNLSTPTSTLFPYTTLFRSKMKALLTIAAMVRESGKSVTAEAITKAKTEGATDIEIHDTVLIAALFCLYNRYVDGLGDRKSTRLNSSHLVISYAVFCLKKKK